MARQELATIPMAEISNMAELIQRLQDFNVLNMPKTATLHISIDDIPQEKKLPPQIATIVKGIEKNGRFSPATTKKINDNFTEFKETFDL